MNNWRLMRVTMPFACFGLDVRGEWVYGAPPIARWCIGKSAEWVCEYWRRRGGAVEWVEI